MSEVGWPLPLGYLPTDEGQPWHLLVKPGQNALPKCVGVYGIDTGALPLPPKALWALSEVREELCEPKSHQVELPCVSERPHSMPAPSSLLLVIKRPVSR